MSLSAQKPNYHNYLTLSNACKVLNNGAKPFHHHNPENILTDNIRQLWLTKELPAVCILDLRNLIDKPHSWNRIGFMSWHQYDSNPKLIEVEYTSQDNPENAVWVVLAKIRLELTSNWQHFKLPLIPSKNVSFLKLKIMQNYAQPIDRDSHESPSEAGTYLNQASLGFVEQIIQSRVELTAVSNLHQREKTFSDYRKVSGNDRELKKLGQKMKHLSNDNQVMRRTIDHQNAIIIKLQQAIQTLVENVGRLQAIQKAQDKKIRQLEKSKERSANNKNPTELRNKKQPIQQFFNDESQIMVSASDKPRSRERPRSQHTSAYQEPSHISRTNKQSLYRTSQEKPSNQKSRQSNQRRVINANINESEQSLSEYEGVIDERVYRYVKRGSQAKAKEGVYIPMLQKLQELIMLRDEKKNKLKTHKKHKRSANIVVPSSESLSQPESDN